MHGPRQDDDFGAAAARPPGRPAVGAAEVGSQRVGGLARGRGGGGAGAEFEGAPIARLATGGGGGGGGGEEGEGALQHISPGRSLDGLDSLTWSLFMSLLTHRLVFLCVDAYYFTFWDLLGDVLAAAESALCGWIGVILLSLSACEAGQV